MAVKQYREGNITAAFGTDLFIHGVTFVPSLLLKSYRQMGLNESEMMLLLHLLRLRTEEKELCPPAALLGGFMSGGQAQAERDLEGLLAKGVIAVTQYFREDDQGVTEGYDFEPLFEKLSEAWARSKVHEIELTQALLENGAHAGLEDRELGQLCAEFAREFGRPLSPIEAEQVSRWYSGLGPALVREALRRAVLIGKYNFRYIDSILLAWHKNNVRTIEQVHAFEQEFQQLRSKRKPKKAAAESRNREKEKALIKALYMS
ncbi:DnaD domain-containing protein [Candidatus Desulforudis audaxviator]|uniref:Primosome, DnaD subunit n=1 Tax=Desulforudis audaxviator (strain MP104C) TaxID=477974 RepID=B1I350_DESAP|nr:DnaD domain protein [Candidatus Desulforudis audaxviator]ACA59405.1 primosome, DnaD subunit [Candidatus Desulforudis audaxviator MP104C]AZK59387.1 Chromosome replication initiation protein DnaD [Candidatus Desulforudis audaxviator]